MIREQTLRARHSWFSKLPITGELLRGTLLGTHVRAHQKTAEMRARPKATRFSC